MNENQQKFLNLAKYSEELTEQQSKVREELAAVMLELGKDSFVQDLNTGIVYQVVKPNGSFTYYKDLDYIRTKKEGERAGSLSVKKAEEAGFKLNG